MATRLKIDQGQKEAKEPQKKMSARHLKQALLSGFGSEGKERSNALL